MDIRAKKNSGKQLTVEIISCLFFVLFLYAAANKLLDYQRFKIQLSQSPLLTEFANQVAWLIPTIELIIAFIVITPKTRSLGLYGSLALMSLFTAYIIAILNFSDHIPCGCGGILGHLQWHEHLLFNIFFVSLGIVAIYIKKNMVKMD